MIYATLTRTLSWRYRIFGSGSNEAIIGRRSLEKAFFSGRGKLWDWKRMDNLYSIPIASFLFHAHTQPVKQKTSLAMKKPPRISRRHQVSSLSSPTHQGKKRRHCKQRHKPPQTFNFSAQRASPFPHTGGVSRLFGLHIRS